MAEFIGATRCCAADADIGGWFNISEQIPSLRNIVPEGWISWANDGCGKCQNNNQGKVNVK